ncbi:MAG: sulfite exporter TauE/SafE family protein [Ignavibacteria bacterium]|nr:sulfite exporter TauE/SafE family protein [Ignavibacteria bacterium]
MELWSAFAIGFFGSFHCIGMCGAIAFALPQNSTKWKFLAGRILYNLGRVMTYTLFGVFFGFVGQAVSLAGLQEKLSIILGVLILAAVLIPHKYTQNFLSIGIFAPLVQPLKKNIGRLFGNGSMLSLLSIGILNGLLPCGFVYLGIAGSMTTESVSSAALYMALFGLGTLPTMLIASLATNLISMNVRNTIRKFLPVGMATLAVLFILRGMSLGIPYISPKLSSTPVPQGECHP